MSSSSNASNDAVQLYKYTPSIVAAIIAISVFGILTITHTYRLLRTRFWFCLPFVFGGLFEAIGYVGRALGHSSPQALGPYIINSILVLVAPALFAATIYMTLGRLMRATGAEYLSIIRVNWLTKVFVLGDIFSFFVQGSGGGMMASTDKDKAKSGQYVIIGGLFIQLALFGFFVAVSILFNLRLKKDPTRLSRDSRIKWEKMMAVLYTISALIIVRNVFRVVEFVEGREGALLKVEWTIYVFDALLMASTMVVFAIGYPTMIKTVAGDVEAGMQLGTDVEMSPGLSK